MAGKILTPILPVEMEWILEDEAELYNKKDEEETVKDVLIRNLRVEGGNFSSMRFSAVLFENCMFQDCNFEKGEFTDVIFQSCDISNCSFENSYFNRILFRSSKGMGAKFCGNTMLHTLVENSNFNYVNFDSSKLEQIRFSDTQIQGGSLSQCRCKAVEWSRANLEHVSFFQTLMAGMDFTDSIIHSLVLSENCHEVRGAVVDLYQAAELAKYLGIVIKNV